jgi:hypothetical protein
MDGDGDGTISLEEFQTALFGLSATSGASAAGGGEAAIMAQRKKRPTVRKGKSIARRKARKPSKSARRRPAKRTVSRATPSKRLAKAKLKRGAKKARKMKPPSTPVVETVVVDVIEEPVAGVTVITEFEATEVHEPTAPRQLEEGQGPAYRKNHRIALPTGAGQIAAACTSCVDPPMFCPDIERVIASLRFASQL